MALSSCCSTLAGVSTSRSRPAGPAGARQPSAAPGLRASRPCTRTARILLGVRDGGAVAAAGPMGRWIRRGAGRGGGRGRWDQSGGWEQEAGRNGGAPSSATFRDLLPLHVATACCATGRRTWVDPGADVLDVVLLRLTGRGAAAAAAPAAGLADR